eukprot:COSAG06_NODE_792_length_12273_cov_19.284048_7_plen_415_part_00
MQEWTTPPSTLISQRTTPRSSNPWGRQLTRQPAPLRAAPARGPTAAAAAARSARASRFTTPPRRPRSSAAAATATSRPSGSLTSAPARRQAECFAPAPRPRTAASTETAARRPVRINAPPPPPPPPPAPGLHPKRKTQAAHRGGKPPPPPPSAILKPAIFCQDRLATSLPAIGKSNEGALHCSRRELQLQSRLAWASLRRAGPGKGGSCRRGLQLLFPQQLGRSHCPHHDGQHRHHIQRRQQQQQQLRRRRRRRQRAVALLYLRVEPQLRCEQLVYKQPGLPRRVLPPVWTLQTNRCEETQFAFVPLTLYQNTTSSCQDRLGTHIGKALKKEINAFFLAALAFPPFATNPSLSQTRGPDGALLSRGFPHLIKHYHYARTIDCQDRLGTTSAKETRSQVQDEEKKRPSVFTGSNR